MNRSPAFQPRASASARSGGSSSSASKLTAPTSAIVARAAAQALARSSPRPSAWARAIAGSTRQLVDPQEADELADRAEPRQPLLDDRQQRPDLLVGGHPVDPAGARARPRGRAAAGRRGRRASSRRIHWPLSHSRRSRSKTAPALWTSVEVEALDDLVEREDLLLGPGRPAEQRQVVDERLADEALGAVVVDRRLALALAHLRPVRVEDERQVGERGHVVAERPEQQDVLGRVRDVVLAADDVGDLHRGVVDDDREVVERRAVGADDDEVAAEVGRRRSRPGRGRCRRSRRRPPRRGSGVRRLAALGLERGALLRGQVARSGRVARRQPGPPPEPLALRVELLGACSSRGRPCRPRGAAGRPPRTAAAAASGGTGRTARGRASPATSGPSSQRSPSQWSPSRMSFS